MINIRQKRIEHQVSENTMADKLGITVYKLRELENNPYTIKKQTAIRMAEILNISLEELFYNELREPINISKLTLNQLDIVFMNIHGLDIHNEAEKKKIREMNTVDFPAVKDMGEKIKHIRVNILGLSVKNMALKMGLSVKSTTQSWENPEGLVQMGKILQITDESHIYLDFLLKDNVPFSVSPRGLDELLS